VKDSRPLLAILVIMVIAILPGMLMKRPPPAPAGPPAVADSTAGPRPVAGDTTGAGLAVPAAADPLGGVPASPAAGGGPADSLITAVALVDDTIVVRSELYEYRFSTVGARLVSSRFLHYRSMHPADTVGGARQVLELLRPGESLLDARMVFGTDSAQFNAASFTANATTLDVTSGPATLTMSGTVAGRPVTIDYSFVPDDYRIGIAGRMTGIGANGATLVTGIGNGFRDTESNIPENHRESGIVTKLDDTDLTRFNSLDPLQTTVLSGPFEWVAVKSKYFVAGFFAYDTTRTDAIPGQIGGVIATVSDTLPTKPVRARTAVTLPVGSAGTWNATLYLGPMEYNRLTGMGREFDDVNPYGWPGFRTVIRPFAVAIRAAFVWMHQTLNLHYGLAIVLFGIMVRLMLWPLNQKAMRSMTAMQAIQPQLQAIQAKYKEDPPRLQQEMLKLYKENKVNPFGGCWPMLIPYPFLVAVFFVLQNTIELRGVSFLWMPDLSRADPLFIIPIFMSLSMFALSKIGQMGMPPNPQAKMMTYVMPVVFGVLFFSFASGLNLYYAVQNVAALPQQWMIMKERQKLNLNKTAKQTVHTKKK
jgi:YidC/Oxa1 family membrane protein insertase